MLLYGASGFITFVDLRPFFGYGYLQLKEKSCYLHISHSECDFALFKDHIFITSVYENIMVIIMSSILANGHPGSKWKKFQQNLNLHFFHP